MIGAPIPEVICDQANIQKPTAHLENAGLFARGFAVRSASDEFPLCRRIQKGACRSGRTLPRSDGNKKPRCSKLHLVNNMYDIP